MQEPTTRRDMLRAVTAAAATVVTTSALADVPALVAASPAPVATRGRIKQSLVSWCYAKHWKEDEMAVVAKNLGCVSIELIDPKHWDMLKSHGLTCAIAGSHGFVQGMNNPKYHESCLGILRAADRPMRRRRRAQRYHLHRNGRGYSRRRRHGQLRQGI